MKTKSIFWLASMLMCGVLWLPVAVNASPNTPSIPAAPIAFCDSDLSGLVSTMLAFNAANGGVSSIGNGLGIWQRGTTSCWEYSGALASGAHQFSLQSNLAQDVFLSNQDICYSGAYKYCLNQTFDHPANQVINIGFNTLTFNSGQLDNYYQICYDSNLTGGIACVTGAPTGSTNVVVTLPISGTDKLQIDGHGLAVQYVTLGNNASTPTATNTPTVTATPGPGTATPTSTPGGLQSCGLVQDCYASTLPTNAHTPCASAYWSCLGNGVLYVAQYAPDSAFIFGTTSSLIQNLSNTNSGSGTYNVSFSFRLQPGDTGVPDVQFRINGAQYQYNQSSGPCIAFSATTYCPVSIAVPAASMTTGAVQIAFRSNQNGGSGTLELYQPTVNYVSANTATPTPANTPTRTVTPTPSASATSTPVSFDGTALPTYTPAPTSTPTFLPGTPTPTPTPAPCQGNGAPSVPPPSNIIPTNIANIPLLGGMVSEFAKLLNGGWNFAIDILVPQNLNCDFGSIQTAVSTRITVPNMATVVQPLAYPSGTACGYLGVQNLPLVRPNGISISNPFTTTNVNIGVDGCAAPWITYFPFGRSMINFSMLVWFAISSVKFFLSFFSGKSFDVSQP